jgi:putative ABC transport system ATP-binding protein
VPEHFLAVENVRVCFGKGDAQVHALQGVSASFEPGTLSLIIGPSGSGKTTLLSLLGCLLSPDEGSVFVDGVAVTGLGESEKTTLRRTKVGFIFQAFRLLHSLSVLDNVALSLEIRDRGRRQSRDNARELLVQLGLGAKLNHEIDGLSPGEKQRVAIARALGGDPPILLADEPTASLDASAGKNICEILRNQAEQNRKAVVVVSHDSRWQEYATRRLFLSDGRIQQRNEVNAS